MDRAPTWAILDLHYALARMIVRRMAWQQGLDDLIERYRAWRRRRAIEAARIDPEAKCPACGHRSGVIKFEPKEKLVRHTCSICGATWGEATIVEVTAWLR